MATMAAKFPGVCKKCGGRFAAGTWIEWSRSAGSSHEICPTGKGSASGAASPVVSIETAPYESSDRFDPCKRPVFEAMLRAMIGETRCYTRRGPTRRGATGDERVPVPGYYVVCGYGRIHYQSASENEDMGDMMGANWQAQLFLRPATPAEIEAAQRQELAGQIGPIFTAMVGMIRRGEERRAKEAFEAAASRPGWAKVEVVCLAELGDEVVEARKTATRLWAATGQDYSYVQTFAVGGDTIVESYKYVYDWDLPLMFAVPAALAERTKLVQAIVQWGWAIQSLARRSTTQAAKLAA